MIRFIIIAAVLAAILAGCDNTVTPSSTTGCLCDDGICWRGDDSCDCYVPPPPYERRR